MRKKSFVLLITVLLASSALWCQTPENKALNLEQCISIALQQNPLILSSLQQHQASLARISQAKAFPQPSIDIDSDLQPKFFNLRVLVNPILELPSRSSFPVKDM